MHLAISVTISISHTIYWHLFRDFSPLHSPVKEKGKQGKMKGLTMVQGININWNNKSVLTHWYSVLWEKTGPIILLYASGAYGRQAGRQNTGGFWNFKNSLQVKLFRLLFCLLSLQYCYSISTAFQSTFVK